MNKRIPPPEKWISLSAAARMLRVNRRSIDRARSKGRLDPDKNRHYLASWKTLEGIVTTKEECEAFMNAINGWRE